jgi:hypothetical protein
LRGAAAVFDGHLCGAGHCALADDLVVLPLALGFAVPGLVEGLFGRRRSTRRKRPARP